MKRIVTLLLILLFTGSATEIYAQNWLDQLGRKVKEKAKQKTEEKILQSVDKTIDKAFDKAEDTVTGKDKKKGKEAEDSPEEPAVPETPSVPVQQPAPAPAPAPAPQVKQSPELAYAKSDFVAGDEIIFEDNFDAEQIGEFPSQWELIEGVSEVVSVGGKKAMLLNTWGTKVCPLMKDPYNHLGDVFTIEYDIMFPPLAEGVDYPWIHATFVRADYKDTYSDGRLMNFVMPATDIRGDGSWSWKSSRGDNDGAYDTVLPADQWNHIAFSFNKRAWKIYLNGVRIANVPNVAEAPGWMYLFLNGGDGNTYITNVRIAKGAVPLYDRMMSEGKFVTYGITFDVGKAVIKPESMGEINRIVQLLNENPSLKFSVEGHTDSTGNAASNQKLSEERSQAIVAKLVEMGIAADRLTAVGKGQNNPIADNGTDEGRAKNRRVEFVKM